MQYIALQSLKGLYVVVQGSATAVGVIISYTPASGKNFMFLNAEINASKIDSTYEWLAEIRNAGTVRASRTIADHDVETIVMQGDILAGNGSSTYDMYVSVSGTTGTIYGTFSGVILSL